MKLSIKDKDSALWDVIDLNTNERVSGVQWADDELGRYSVFCYNEKGVLKYSGNKVLIEYKEGFIKIIKKNVGLFDRLLRFYCSIKRRGL